VINISKPRINPVDTNHSLLRTEESRDVPLTVEHQVRASNNYAVCIEPHYFKFISSYDYFHVQNHYGNTEIISILYTHPHIMA
jgi:hypothetical protein